MAMRMAVPRSWFSIVRKKFLARTTKFGPHSKNIIIIHNNTSITSNEEDNRTSCVDHTKDGNIVISSSSPGRDDDEIRTTGVTATTTEEDVDSTTDDSKKEIKTSSGVDSTEEEEESIDQEELGPSKEKINAAAIRIQSVFRGHLARRALRALRSLVKLQAVARGMHIRRQVTTALNCMHALVRLQLRVRARKLLNGSSNNHF